MPAESTQVWHRWLFDRAYTMFRTPPPEPGDAWAYGVTVGGALLFMIAALPALVLLNLATLPFGVFTEPLWWTEARFRRLAFPGGIPIIAIALPFWLAVASWRTYLLRGPAIAFGAWPFVLGLALLLFAGAGAFNRIRATRLQSRSADPDGAGQLLR